MIRCTAFRPDHQNTRAGYCTLEVAGLVIKDCVLHELETGKSWIAFPANNTSIGKVPRWSAVVSFTATVDRPEWQAEAVQAVNEFRRSLPPLVP